MLLYETEYLEYIADYELTLPSRESSLIMKLNFHYSSKNIMKELRDEFVSININMPKLL